MNHQIKSGIVALSLSVLAALSLPAAKIGDPAAALSIGEWIKGQPVDLAAVKGEKIVVVEFWATWCGPCRVSIPHLTEMQQKFADRDVVFVGISDEDPATVREFVNKMGEKMDYVVACDANRQTSDGYMKAFGKNGIPQAFIVDRDGNIAWEGHPMGDLEKTLERLASVPGKKAVSPEDQKRLDALRKLREYADLAATGAAADKLTPLETELMALDREVGGLEKGRKLDLAAVRRAARFQSLARDYQRAAAAGKSEAELARIEQEAKPFAPPGFKFSDLRVAFGLQRVFQDYYRAVSGTGDAATVAELGRKVELAQSNDAELLNEAAWTLLTDAKIKTRDVKLALKLAESAVQVSGGKDAGVLDTYARALFDNGQRTEAVAQQKRALALVEDADKRTELAATLKEYEAKLK